MVVGDKASFVGCSDEPVVPYSGDSGVDAGDGASAVVFEGEFPKTPVSPLSGRVGSVRLHVRR